MHATIKVFKRKDGDWDWHLVAPNGEIIAGSLQGYTEKNDAHEAAQRVIDSIIEGAPIEDESPKIEDVPLPDGSDV